MRRVLLLGLLLLTTACKEEEVVPPPPKGRVQGVLTPFQSNSQSEEGGVSAAVRSPFGARTLASLEERIRGLRQHRGGLSGPVVTDPGLPIVLPPPGPPPLARIPQEDPTIPGDVILRFEEAGLLPERVLEAATLPGYRAVHKGYASEHLHLVGFEALDGHAVTAEETRGLVARLAQVPGVRWADRNLRMYKFKVPDDRGYSLQWHYPTLNLPAAWDLESDATGVVVAVLDTGIVPHPDLDSRKLQGYDMIQDAANAGDGNGRDNNPLDEGGDEPGGGSSWHGTHVAGTIGAVTNNGSGIAGVTWNARVLPVRVLGKQGGTSFDIAAAMTWASGGTVTGVPPNPTPAKVLNLSLGGAAPPQAVYQEAINAAVTRGAIFVIAAGNENVDASNSTPCNQERVICVGSTNLSGKRSSFSNFGARVDVMAPGGEMREDLNGDSYPDGVLSTARDDDRQPSYLFQQGTSMASPHVAGVVALMAAAATSVGQTLSADQAESLLKSSATSIPQCTGGCGSGLVNAQAVLRRIRNSDPNTEAPKLSVTTSTLFFRGSGTQQLTLSNVGGRLGGELQVTASVSGARAAAVSFPRGASVTVPAFGSASLDVAVNAAGLPEGETVVAMTLTGSGNAGSATVAVKISVGEDADLDAIIAFVWQDTAGEWQASEELITAARAVNDYAYAIEMTPRTYYALATIDDDRDGEFFEEGERTGFWRNLDSFESIELDDGETLSNVSFDLLPLAPIEDEPELVVGGTCTSDANCSGGTCLPGPGYPGGYCTQDCTTRACPAGSKCYLFGATEKLCLATCSSQIGTGRGNCRNDYVCYSDGTGGGACQPSCLSSTLSCATGTVCRSDGFCR